MSEGSLLGKGIFGAVAKFFENSARELKAPFQDLADSLGANGHGLSFAGAGGGSLDGKFADEMSQWNKDAARRYDGTASMAKKNSGGGVFKDKNAAKRAAENDMSAKKISGDSRQGRFRDVCSKKDHVHVDYVDPKTGQVDETKHFGFKKK